MSRVTVEILEDKYYILSEVWMKDKINEIKMFFKDLSIVSGEKNLIKHENYEVQL